MLLSRVQGSLVAAVVGDCIGCLFECSGNVSMEEVLDAVQKIELKAAKGKDETEGDTHELPFTDDTAMARSIAASLIEYKDINVPDIAARFAKEFEQEPARGYGAGVVTVLYALADPDLKDVFQPARKQFNGSGSYGNGGGMRIAPLGLFLPQPASGGTQGEDTEHNQIDSHTSLCRSGGIAREFCRSASSVIGQQQATGHQQLSRRVTATPATNRRGNL